MSCARCRLSRAQVDHLHEGIALGMKGSIEKRSEVLGRDALWSKTVRIKRLPRYVCVQARRPCVASSFSFGWFVSRLSRRAASSRS